MLNEKSISSLGLSPEQLEKFRELEHKEEFLRNALEQCGVMSGAIRHIIAQSDLNKVDLNNMEVLKEGIRNEWKDFIFERKR